MDTTICIFAKPPVPGRVNTRLIPAVGEAAAAELARAFLLDTIETAQAHPWARVVLATTGDLPRDLPVPPAVLRWDQGEGDLGNRVERVLRRALEEADAALALGVDTPGLPSRLVETAHETLMQNDAVIGPCDDGGFYTLGLRRCPPDLLADLPWGASETASRTIARLRTRGLRVAILEAWFDVDRPRDLDRLRTELETGVVTARHTAAALSNL